MAETAASVSIASAFLEQEVSNGRYMSDGTHVKDLKNSVKVRSPSGDLLLVALCMQMLRKRVSFPLLVDVPLDLGHRSGVRWRASLTRY